MKMRGGQQVLPHHSASRTVRFNLGERAHDTQWIRGWVGTRAVEKIKMSCPFQEINPGRPAHRYIG
jgi:hypothetical protein